MARLFARKAEAEGEPSRPRIGARLKLLVIVLLIAGFVGVAADWVTSSPKVCTSCHEMSVRADSWKVSAHAGVKCVSCHQPPHAWYAWPLTLADRGGLLSRDIYRHLNKQYEDPVDSRPADVPAMPSSVCLQCHSADRKATSGYRIKIDHPAHAKLNKTCVSCHVRTAHPLPERGRAISLMAQCFTCHGTKAYPKAGTACTLCHPSGYELKPTSHKTARWEKGHGSVWKKDAQQCTLCHQKTFCTDCHGLDMPHPPTWAKKGAAGHSAAAAKDRAVCTRCHVDAPDLCGSCHHTAWVPARGPWVKQHFLVARDKGTTSCLACHEPKYCVRCHVTYATQQ